MFMSFKNIRRFFNCNMKRVAAVFGALLCVELVKRAARICKM